MFIGDLWFISGYSYKAGNGHGTDLLSKAITSEDCV